LTIPLDKQAHFFAGSTLVLVFAIFGHFFAGLCVAIALGAVKEWWWDRIHPQTHSVDPWDFAATVSGGLAAFALALIAWRLK
jgi:hypothetical protein